jgi:hypothetical protein
MYVHTGCTPILGEPQSTRVPSPILPIAVSLAFNELRNINISLISDAVFSDLHNV